MDILNTKAGSLAVALLVSDADLAAILKWRALYRQHGGLAGMSLAMFTADEQERLDRLNDSGILCE